MEIGVPVLEDPAHLSVTKRNAFGDRIDRGDLVIRPLPAIAENPVQPNVVRLHPILRTIIRVRKRPPSRMHFSVRVFPRRTGIEDLVHLNGTLVRPARQRHALPVDVQFHGRHLAEIVGEIIPVAA
ncbi:hypothetical protein D3C74_278510 [compost metagenome]